MSYVKERMSVCEACPKLIKDSEFYCAACGCELTKLTLNPWQACPDQRWASITDDRELDRIVINDRFFSLQQPETAYTMFIRQEFDRRWPGVDPESKFWEQVHANS